MLVFSLIVKVYPDFVPSPFTEHRQNVRDARLRTARGAPRNRVVPAPAGGVRVSQCHCLGRSWVKEERFASV
ncbi:unnamed protein product [Durusdinium trenchii]|uniref:Uncharacterized protein n=2 Tax=Durusdinium trenchii TaxID=1381693 RepID=A0ABP0MI62_9DINO